MTKEGAIDMENIPKTGEVVDGSPDEKTPTYVGRVLPIKLVAYKDGWRKEFGDIIPFARNIKKAGLLNPITVVRNGTKYEIVAGHRRYEAIKKLGWHTIEVRMRVTDIIMSESPCAVCGYKIAEESFGTSLCANHQMMFVVYHADETLWNSIKARDVEGSEFIMKSVSTNGVSGSDRGVSENE